LQLLISVIVSSLLKAQGIQFEQGTWNEALAKAKQKNKLLYVDFIRHGVDLVK
jgi:hypothetical protein